MITVPCNLCGHDESKVIQKAEPPFSVVRCDHCGLVYTKPIPDLNELANHYDEGYYHDWMENQRAARERMWKKRLAEVKAFKPRGRLLDVGCGVETFLRLAREDGFDVKGTEVSKFIAGKAGGGAPLDVFQGQLPDARFPDAHFDVITFWHSLEHMPDPKRNLEEARRILKQDGVLVIAVPNLNNYIMRFCYRLVKGKPYALFSKDAKELHLYHFTVQTLKRMLDETGFKTQTVKPDLSAVVFQRKLIDYLSAGIYALTGRNFADGIKLYARKA